ncbi:putative AMP-binding enzyme [Cadophora sp. MPI-SDFR-AT-0126]|nr:putative AMP-binding enzyme [Leotiomycetes sp. MPI-SDFR-AT-0126]
MYFRSSHPDIDIPTNITTYSFLFSNANQYLPSQDTSPNPKGFTNTFDLSRLSHSEIQILASNISTSLVLKHGLQPGDVVSICSPNTIQYPAILYGIMRAGGIPALSSPAFNEEDLMHVFKTVDCKMVFCPNETVNVVRGALRNLGRRDDCVVSIDEINSGRSEAGIKSLGDLIEEGRGRRQVPEWEMPNGKTNSEICALLCFSSGTTGLPKAVMISHQNIITQCLQLIPTTSPDHKTVLGMLPFYHITGVVKMLVLPFVIGAEVVILPQFTMKGLLSTIEHYQIAEVQLVPPIIIRLVNDPIVNDYDLSCVERFASGAAPISEEVLQLLEKKFPGRGFKQGYGMTESTGCITTHPLDKHAFRYARTGGTLVANTVVKVVNDKGKLLGIGEQGEILAKGPQIFLGYLKNPTATSSAFDSSGFLRTGDIGCINADGCIVIHDRIKEMIKVKGVQVAPAELEDLLLGHPMVEDCAVIGVPDDYAGERPFAFVVLRKKDGEDDGGLKERTRELLIEYVRMKKGRGKRLVGVRFVESIPKSASGKILRRVLREDYARELAMVKAKL